MANKIIKRSGGEGERNPLPVLCPAIPEGADKRTMYRNIMRLVLPAGLEFMLLQFVNVFDQIQVSAISTYATNGVGMVNQIKLLFTTVFVAVGVGVTALSARAKGREDLEGIREVLRHGLILTGILSAAASIFAIFFAEKLLRLVGAPDEQSFAQGLIYLKICIISFIPSALTAAVTAALRGAGDAKTPLFYNVTANAVNVFLNWVLINGKLGMPRMGIAGAATATVISLTVSFFLAMLAVFSGHRGLRLSLRGLFRPMDRTICAQIMGLGLPAMAEQLIVRVGLTAFTSIVSKLGTDTYAVHTICVNIQYLTYVNGMAFQVAATAMSGQSLGAGRPDLAAAYSTACARIGCLGALVLSVLYAFGGGALIWLYRKDPVIIAAGIAPLRIMALMQPLTALQYVFSGTIRSAGDTKFVAWASIFTTFLLRPAMAWLLVTRLDLGLIGAWVAMATDQSVCALLLTLRYRTGKWLTMAQKMQENKSNDRWEE